MLLIFLQLVLQISSQIPNRYLVGRTDALVRFLSAKHVSQLSVNIDLFSFHSKKSTTAHCRITNVDVS